MSPRNVDDGSLRFLSLEQITEDVLKAQQAAYSVEGVDESVRCSLLASRVLHALTVLVQLLAGSSCS